MIDNKEIWRGAKLLVKARGERAEVIAAQHVDERLTRGDLVGRDVWRQILAGVRNPHINYCIAPWLNRDVAHAI
jgi:hypothetical protein